MNKKEKSIVNPLFDPLRNSNDTIDVIKHEKVRIDMLFIMI